MIPTIVVDCSITMAWCFADEASDAATAVQERLIDEAAIVPAHWFLEVTNVLAMAERRKRISALGSTQFLQLIQKLDIQADHEVSTRAFDHLLPLCRSHSLTSYDAAYLDLAVRCQLPLASLDDDLRRAAVKLGVSVLGK